MGLDINGTKFLLFAERAGVSFKNSATIGRQMLLLPAEAFAANLSRSGKTFDAKELLTASEGYCETFLRSLGAETVTSFDASDYESATVIHDFNEPISDDQKGKFSMVLDGGTLEHIFNYPTALKNCMEMVAEGGHFLAITPTNNFPGHGFYQFSPELFFNVLNEANGFELERLIFFEDKPDAQWYEISDPRKHNRRVTFMNGWPSYLLVIARKKATVPIFRNTPQQSDYTVMWDGKDLAEGKTSGGFAAKVVRSLRYRMLGFGLEFGESERAFTKIDPFA